MSSLEVLKHARHVFSIIKGKTLQAKHKIVEISIEIAIIVFAISLSLYLERWREEKDDQHIETRFLEGLESDLGTDLKELRLSSARCNAMKQAAGYFLRPAAKINWSADSVNRYAYELFHNVYFFPNSNRYESLKSTGKLSVIADKGLQDDIIDLYQTRIPDLQEQVNFFNDFMNNDVKNYLIQNFKRDSDNHVLFDKTFFTSAQTKNILSFYGDLDDVQKRIQATIKTIEKIMVRLDDHRD